MRSRCIELAAGSALQLHRLAGDAQAIGNLDVTHVQRPQFVHCINVALLPTGASGSGLCCPPCVGELDFSKAGGLRLNHRSRHVNNSRNRQRLNLRHASNSTRDGLRHRDAARQTCIKLRDRSGMTHRALQALDKATATVQAVLAHKEVPGAGGRLGMSLPLRIGTRRPAEVVRRPRFPHVRFVQWFRVEPRAEHVPISTLRQSLVQLSQHGPDRPFYGRSLITAKRHDIRHTAQGQTVCGRSSTPTAPVMNRPAAAGLNCANRSHHDCRQRVKTKHLRGLIPEHRQNPCLCNAGQRIAIDQRHAQRLQCQLSFRGEDRSVKLNVCSRQRDWTRRIEAVDRQGARLNLGHVAQQRINDDLSGLSGCAVLLSSRLLVEQAVCIAQRRKRHQLRLARHVL